LRARFGVKEERDPCGAVDVLAQVEDEIARGERRASRSRGADVVTAPALGAGIEREALLGCEIKK
jgi:hypothetical protein